MAFTDKNKDIYAFKKKLVVSEGKNISEDSGGYAPKSPKNEACEIRKLIEEKGDECKIFLKEEIRKMIEDKIKIKYDETAVFLADKFERKRIW